MYPGRNGNPSIFKYFLFLSIYSISELFSVFLFPVLFLFILFLFSVSTCFFISGFCSGMDKKFKVLLRLEVPVAELPRLFWPMSIWCKFNQNSYKRSAFLIKGNKRHNLGHKLGSRQGTSCTVGNEWLEEKWKVLQFFHKSLKCFRTSHVRQSDGMLQISD